MAEVTDTVSDSSASPLLRPRQAGGNGGDSVGRTNTLALLLSRAAGRRGASSLVRETAAMQLAERRADWGYSKPVVALDVAWNLGFTVVSVVMLVCTLNERPNVPIRVWICGYAFQCLVHVMLVWLEYRRRTMTGMRSSEDGGRSSDSDGNDSEDESGDAVEYRSGSRSSFAKRCESINTIASFLWWIVGFYWIISGGEALAQNAPRLYWLAVVFLAFDVFFAIFCIALAFMIGVALCCCLPCIIAILYAVAGQEGATESDISMLARYRYEECGNDEKPSAGAGLMVPIGGEFAIERALLSEDAECCICISSYEDGTELHALPCGHHFHATCIVRWLKINASCPLCKYNILKGNNDPV